MKNAIPYVQPQTHIMTKAQRKQHKQANATRRDSILKISYKKKLGDNMLLFLGGVGQKSKYSTI